MHFSYEKPSTAVSKRFEERKGDMYKLLESIPLSWWNRNPHVDFFLLSFVDHMETLNRFISLIKEKKECVTEKQWTDFLASIPSSQKILYSQSEFKNACKTEFKNIPDFQTMILISEKMNAPKGGKIKVFHWTVPDPEVTFLHGVSFITHPVKT